MTWTRLLLSAAAIAGIALGALTAGWALQRRLVYLPGPDPGPPPPEWREVVLRTDDGIDLVAWSRDVLGAAATVVVFHGNAGTRADRSHLGDGLADRGFRVLLVDYRGYGGNPGSPSEQGLTADARAAVAAAGPGPLVYFGESLGAAVAVRLAVQRPPAALVLRSPFTSLGDVARLHYPLPSTRLLWDRFDALGYAGDVDVPTLVIAGTADRVVPFTQSRAVAEALGAELLAIGGADHNDPRLAAGDEVLDAVAAFVEAALASR